MAKTTLQNIMQTIRDIRAVDPSKVNYGVTDNQSVPYVSVTNYEHAITYDTGGPAIKDAKYSVTVIDKSQDGAEELAALIDDVLNNSATVTPTTLRNLQADYKVGQVDPSNLYQYGVQIDYELQEGA